MLFQRRFITRLQLNTVQSKIVFLVILCGFGGLEVVRRFKPGRNRRIFRGEKILSTPAFGREVKQFVPCRILGACKTTRNCMRESRSFRSKLQAISRPSSSPFLYQGSLVEALGGASRNDLRPKTGGHAVAQLVEALRYKSEGRGFDSQWCHWNFSLA